MRSTILACLAGASVALGVACTEDHDPGTDISAVKAAPDAFAGQSVTVAGKVESAGADVITLSDPETPEHTLFVVRTPEIDSSRFLKASAKDQVVATGQIAYYVQTDVERDLDVNLNQETRVAIEGQPVLMARSVAGWEQM